MLVDPDRMKRAGLQALAAAVAQFRFQFHDAGLLVLHERPRGTYLDALCVPAHPAIHGLEDGQVHARQAFFDPNAAPGEFETVRVVESTDDGAGPAAGTGFEINS